MLRSITTENHSNQEQAIDFWEQQESDVSKACIRLVESTDREEQVGKVYLRGEKMVKRQGNK